MEDGAMPRRAAAVIALIAMLLIACGGSAATSTTVGPSEPIPTVDQGDGSGDGSGTSAGDRSKGIFHAELTGGVTKAIDLGFAPPPVSNFHYDGETAYLVWAEANTVLFMTLAPSGDFTVTYGDGTMTLGLGTDTCEMHVDHLDGSSAKGSFSCHDTVVITDTMPTADITGTFEAHT
jgi:hypothetical protein